MSLPSLTSLVHVLFRAIIVHASQAGCRASFKVLRRCKRGFDQLIFLVGFDLADWLLCNFRVQLCSLTSLLCRCACFGSGRGQARSVLLRGRRLLDWLQLGAEDGSAHHLCLPLSQSRWSIHLREGRTPFAELAFHDRSLVRCRRLG